MRLCRTFYPSSLHANKVLNPVKKLKPHLKIKWDLFFYWKDSDLDLWSANAWELVHAISSQILKIQKSPWITQKRRKSSPHWKFKCFPFLIVCQIVSDFKANFIFHVKNTNTNPLALSAYATNSVSHIKRGFISSAFIYLIIYHKATWFKGDMYLFTEDGQR